MNFSTDRDLLVHEPEVFVNIPLAGQEPLRVSDGSITGTTLSSAGADFTAAQVDVGSVALVAGTAHEIVARVDANTLTVSKLRTRLADAAIAPGDGTGLEIIVRTFAPQAAVVHDVLLHMLGIDADNPDPSLSQDNIVSLSLMARLEALGTLHRLYSGAVALVGDNEELRRKSAEYHHRFNAGCRGASVWMDLDGDGNGDVRVQLGVTSMVRI